MHLLDDAQVGIRTTRVKFSTDRSTFVSRSCLVRHRRDGCLVEGDAGCPVSRAHRRVRASPPT